MNIFSWCKYILKAYCFRLRKDYENCLRTYFSLVKKDSSPYPKFYDYNKKILEIAEQIFSEKKVELNHFSKSTEGKTLILTSEIYDSGGHTELAIRYIEKNKENENLLFVLTGFLLSSKETAPKKSVILKSLLGDNFREFDDVASYEDKIVTIYQYIIANGVTKVISNMHMYDVVGCAILGLLKKYTDIEIEFWNHGDHFYSLGTVYADKIYTRTKNGIPLTPYLKGYKNCENGSFIVKPACKNLLDCSERQKMREELGIPSNSFLTMTGCILWKVNDEYFKLIDKMLRKNPNIYHLFVSPDYPSCKNLMDKKFKHNPRVKMMSATPEFEKYIQITDLYVDSFPQGSALTLVDYIKYKKPVVVKINEKNPIQSFEEYLYPNYEYAFKATKDMLNGILKLASDKKEYEMMSEKCINFFNKKYVEGRK